MSHQDDRDDEDDVVEDYLDDAEDDDEGSLIDEEGLPLDDGDACLVVRKNGDLLCVVPDMESEDNVSIGSPALTVHVLMWLLRSGDRWDEIEAEFVAECHKQDKGEKISPKATAKPAKPAAAPTPKKLLN